MISLAIKLLIKLEIFQEIYHRIVQGQLQILHLMKIYQEKDIDSHKKGQRIIDDLSLSTDDLM